MTSKGPTLRAGGDEGGFHLGSMPIPITGIYVMNDTETNELVVKVHVQSGHVQTSFEVIRTPFPCDSGILSHHVTALGIRAYIVRKCGGNVL